MGPRSWKVCCCSMYFATATRSWTICCFGSDQPYPQLKLVKEGDSIGRQGQHKVLSRNLEVWNDFFAISSTLKSVRVKAKMEDLVSFAIGGGRERERADWRKEVGQGRDAYSIIRDGSKNVQHRDLWLDTLGLMILK